VTTHHPAGTHLLADFHGVDAARLQDGAELETTLRDAALGAGAHILYSHLHGFGEGAGVTGVVLLAESHISIHTWPEYGFAAVDIFMCGSAQPQLALAIIEAALQARSFELRTIERGSQPGHVPDIMRAPQHPH
jgi:S-adenosylmethionine decarboxylase